ncbi:hypothetical protein BH23PLA1_BH23PLA1_11220 [soil metagenome]
MTDEIEPPRTRRERSARYPGVSLAEAIELCRQIDARGLDGLSAEMIATAMGYKNIRTQTFSAKLSAARQFGLLDLAGEGYGLTPLARSILHPTDPVELARRHRQAFQSPPLYAELIARLDGKRVPEAATLANVLYHHHQITGSAKLPAAEAFLESAQFAEVLGPDGILRTGGPMASEASTLLAEPHAEPRQNPSPRPGVASESAGVRLDLRLWGADSGKVIRVRAPETISRASFERFLQAFQLHVQIQTEDAPEDG